MEKRHLINMIKGNQSGMALVIALVILLALTVLGIGAITSSSLDILISSNERLSFEALQIAEAGSDRILSDLLRDFSSDTDPNKWANGNFVTLINGPITLNPDTYYNFSLIINDVIADSAWITNGVDPYGGIKPLGDKAGYNVRILRDASKPDEVYALIRAWRERATANLNLVGGVLRADKKILLYLKAENISIWENSIFSGGGQGGKVITGNVKVIGSVHILGTGQAGQVLALSGDTIIGNNYEAAGTAYSTTLKYRLPTEEKDLEATIRIKNGIANISGSATFGDKETKTDGKDFLSGIYITDGFGSTTSDNTLKSNVFADNYSFDSNGRTAPDYDLGDKVQMPSLSGEQFKDPETGDLYASYVAYVDATALVIEPNNCDLSQATFTCKKPAGGAVDCVTGYGTNKFGFINTSSILNSISVTGLVKLKNDGCTDGFTIGTGAGSDNEKDALYYTGKGTIYTDKSLTIKRSVMPSGGADHKFATKDILGIVTTGEMIIGGSGGDPDLELMGALLSTGKVTVKQSVSIAGTIVADRFTMEQVPTIFEVPALSKNLPKGMPASDAIYNISKIRRKELY